MDVIRQFKLFQFIFLESFIQNIDCYIVGLFSIYYRLKNLLIIPVDSHLLKHPDMKFLPILS